MANADAGRTGEGVPLDQEPGTGSSGTFGSASGQASFRADPFAPESAELDDPFGDETDPFALPPRPAAPAASTSGYEAGSELDLGDGEMRLPWLEGDDEDYEDERGGLGQTTLLLILAVVAIALLAGGIVWALKGRSGETLVADGGVIEAPAEPYKSRPANPGGEVVEGTGDTSFAVAEGQTRTPQIAENTNVPPAPGFSSMTGKGESPAASKPDAATAPAAPAKVEEPAVSGVGVQVGAYTSKESAEKGWLTLKGQYAPLAEMKHRIVQGQADIGTVYRLQAVPGDLKAARSLCSGMRGAGLSCQVKN